MKVREEKDPESTMKVVMEKADIRKSVEGERMMTRESHGQLNNQGMKLAARRPLPSR